MSRPRPRAEAPPGAVPVTKHHLPNPTGTTTSSATAHRILELAIVKLLLIEDDISRLAASRGRHARESR